MDENQASLSAGRKRSISRLEMQPFSYGWKIDFSNPFLPTKDEHLTKPDHLGQHIPPGLDSLATTRQESIGMKL
jgi:hypothetical protein